jgi:hypothetical protein
MSTSTSVGAAPPARAASSSANEKDEAQEEATEEGEAVLCVDEPHPCSCICCSGGGDGGGGRCCVCGAVPPWPWWPFSPAHARPPPARGAAAVWWCIGPLITNPGSGSAAGCWLLLLLRSRGGPCPCCYSLLILLLLAGSRDAALAIMRPQTWTDGALGLPSCLPAWIENVWVCQISHWVVRNQSGRQRADIQPELLLILSINHDDGVIRVTSAVSIDRVVACFEICVSGGWSAPAAG